ncbi:MAG: TetR/AcrR family transcriptional regulator [Micromonosporaceae bacterium]
MRGSVTARVKRPADRREQIAAAAAELFQRHGYHRIGIDDVAAAVGIGGSAVYRHFGSKQELLAETVFDGIRLIEAELATIDAGPPAEQLARIVTAMARIAVTKRQFSALWQLESRHLSDADRDEFRERMRAIVRRQTTLLVATRPALSIAGAELLAWATMSVHASPAYHQIALPGNRLRARLEAMASTVLAVELPVRDAPPPAAGKRPLPDRVSRRERLLEVAPRLFATRGYAAVGIEEIGAAAGVTGPGVYRHFGSKQELLAATLVRGCEWLAMTMSHALSVATSVDDALHRVLTAYVDFAYHHTELLSTLHGELGHLPQAQADQLRRARADHHAEWANLLRAARPGLSAAEAGVLVRGAVGIVNDLPTVHRFRRRAGFPDEVATIAGAVLHNA